MKAIESGKYRIESLIGGIWTYVTSKDSYGEAEAAIGRLTLAYGPRFRVVKVA